MSGERLIFHVDVNSAFLSWEAVERLKHPEQFPEITADLRDIPSAVGGDRSKRRGIILAKSIPAKKVQGADGRADHGRAQKVSQSGDRALTPRDIQGVFESVHSDP